MPKNPKLYTLQEAAEVLNVHPETLRRWDNTGFLVALRVGPRKDRRYNADTIDLIGKHEKKKPKKFS